MDEPLVTPQFVLTEAELKARGVTQAVVRAIFSAGETLSNGAEPDKRGSGFSREVQIAAALLEKNFAEPEIIGIFENTPHGIGSSLPRIRSREAYFEKLFAAARKAFKSKSRSKFAAGYAAGGKQLPPDYEFDDDGAVWLRAAPATEGGKTKRVLVSNSALRITGIRENIESGEISLTIAYDYLGETRSVTITRQQMCEARALVGALAGRGAPINSNNARFLVTYLAAYEQHFGDIIPRTKVTTRFGRGSRGEKFYLPGARSGIEYAPRGAGDISLYNAYAARQGTLDEWVTLVNSLDRERYMIPQIAIITAFVPPLQRYLEIPNFILDIYGATSSGKSTALKLAASVYGSAFDPDSLIYQWMNTKLAVEQLAAVCTELPVYLDDAQHCSDDLKRTVIYMIANGRGKARSSGGRGGLRETLSWQTVALSTSESPLYEASEHEGARGRLLPIGGIVPPFPAGSAALVQSIERRLRSSYGYAGEAFIRHLNRWQTRDWTKWNRRYALLRAELAADASSDLVGRVSSYIAAIGVAAEIVCPLLGLDFKPESIVAWLRNHLRAQQSSQNLTLFALRVLADHYLSNKDAFAGTPGYTASPRALQGVIKAQEYVGFTRQTLDAIFAKYKWRQTMILDKFAAAGALLATEADRHTKKVTYAGAKHRLVCIRWSALLPDSLNDLQKTDE